MQSILAATATSILVGSRFLTNAIIPLTYYRYSLLNEIENAAEMSAEYLFSKMSEKKIPVAVLFH
jgi:hypothetical protein